MTVRTGSRRATAGSRTGTYVVCLDCGKELPYDWSAMKIAQSRGKQPSHTLVTKEAA